MLTSKAYGYMRVSGEGQVDGDGFPRQLLALEKYAKSNDVELVKVFREEGVSVVTETANRPAWAKMMVAIERNGIKTIVVESVNRLARDLLVQEAAIGYCAKNGISLVSVSEPDLMDKDATRKMIRRLLGVVAEWEKDMIVARTRAARERKRAQDGRCEGRKPYGHNPGEMETIARMHELRSLGIGYDKIAEMLTAEGKRTRMGRKRWRGMVVNRILSGKKDKSA